MYGYNIEKNANDPLVDLADEAMIQFSLASQPGVWLVDTLPICKYRLLLRRNTELIASLCYSLVRFLPDWIPGTGFKKTARRWYKTLMEMGDVPYRFVQNQMVKYLSAFM